MVNFIIVGYLAPPRNPSFKLFLYLIDIKHLLENFGKNIELIMKNIDVLLAISENIYIIDLGL